MAIYTFSLNFFVSKKFALQGWWVEEGGLRGAPKWERLLRHVMVSKFFTPTFCMPKEIKFFMLLSISFMVSVFVHPTVVGGCYI